jgi:hypothetical protein
MPRRRDLYVAVSQDGEIEIHAAPCAAGDYATLCGMDGEDDSVGQEPAPLPRGARIDCAHCIDTIRHSRTFRESDFAPEVRKKR